MTLKLSDLMKLADSIPKVPSYISVSPLIWDQLLVTKQDQVELNSLVLSGMRIELAPYYHPDWWSEHYPEKTVIHKGGEVVTIPNVALHPALRPNHTFEIQKEPYEGKDPR